jgi:hypothetical protein
MKGAWNSKMSEIGMMLKKARLDKNLTLDDVQQITKIRKKYLEAIEDNNYAELPGTFYIKAFIKSFADAVGLSSNELIKIHEQSIASSPPELIPTEQMRQNKLPSKNIERMNRWISNSVMISFIVLIIIVIYFFSVRNHSGSDQSSAINQDNLESITDQISSSKPSIEPEPSSNPVVPTPTPTPKVSVVFVKNENGVDLYDVTNAAQLNLSFEIIGERCWIQVDQIDSTNLKILQKQKVYVLGDKDSFTLNSSGFMNIGVASAVKININDTEILFGDYNNPKRIQFNLQK